MKKQDGFTLIEMLLVIAVIAIIAALGIMTYRRYAVTARLDKVAIEMQHVLEAALAYNVDQGEWPEKYDTPTCSITPPDETNDFIKNYVPNQNAQSSYGFYFCWSAKDDNKKARLFWAALKVPHNNLTLGKRLAARLPNAILTAEPQQAERVSCDRSDMACYVRAEVVQPAASSNNAINLMSVVAMGDCPSHNDETNSNKESSTCKRDDLYVGEGTKYQIEFAACSEKYVPRVTVFPNQISFPENNYPGFTVKDINAERTNEPCRIKIDKNGERRQVCNVAVHVTTCTGAGPYKCHYIDIANAKHPGSVGASYVVACVPELREK